MAVPIRGLRNLRTLAGRAAPGPSPYRDYMQVTCLEMEKARREAERRAAARRIAEIDARVRDIESEKARLLQVLLAPNPAEGGAVPDRRLPATRAPAARTHFRLRY